jgi:hypothetical protein
MQLLSCRPFELQLADCKRISRLDPPIEILYDGFNFVNPQIPLFRESFLCDDVLFVPSSLVVENGFPYATFCMNKKVSSGVDADTD